MKEINLHLGGEGHMKPCRDHTGREFPSITEMAAAWGIPLHVLYNRRGRDWPLEKALTTPVGHRKAGTAVDHTGKAYPSLAAMARAWGIDANTLLLRTRYKWPLEKALTTPLRRHFSPVIDPESGVTYTSRAELARALGVSPVTVYRRRCAGLPPELVVFSGKMSCTPSRCPRWRWPGAFVPGRMRPAGQKTGISSEHLPPPHVRRAAEKTRRKNGSRRKSSRRHPEAGKGHGRAGAQVLMGGARRCA